MKLDLNKFKVIKEIKSIEEDKLENYLKDLYKNLGGIIKYGSKDKYPIDNNHQYPTRDAQGNWSQEAITNWKNYTYKKQADFLIGKVVVLSGLDKFKDLYEGFKMPNSIDNDRHDLHNSKNLLEKICYKLDNEKNSINLKQFKNTVINSTLNLCNGGTSNHLHFCLINMESSEYHDKYKYIQQLAYRYARENNLTNDLNQDDPMEVHLVVGLLYGIAEEYNITPNTPDMYINITNNPHVEPFREFLENYLNSVDGAKGYIALKMQTEDYSFPALKDLLTSSSNGTVAIKAWERIEEICKILSLNQGDIIDDENDGNFKYLDLASQAAKLEQLTELNVIRQNLASGIISKLKMADKYLVIGSNKWVLYDNNTKDFELLLDAKHFQGLYHNGINLGDYIYKQLESALENYNKQLSNIIHEENQIDSSSLLRNLAKDQGFVADKKQNLIEDFRDILTNIITNIDINSDILIWLVKVGSVKLTTIALEKLEDSPRVKAQALSAIFGYDGIDYNEYPTALEMMPLLLQHNLHYNQDIIINWAIKRGDVELTEILLEKLGDSPEVNAQDLISILFLDNALCYSCDVSYPMLKIITLLLKHKSYIDQSVILQAINLSIIRSDAGNYDGVQAIEILLEAGANPNSRYEYGNTISFLVYTFSNKLKKVGKEFLNHETYNTYKEIFGIVLRHPKISLTHEDQVLLMQIMISAIELEQFEFVKILLEGGANVNEFLISSLVTKFSDKFKEVEKEFLNHKTYNTYKEIFGIVLKNSDSFLTYEDKHSLLAPIMSWAIGLKDFNLLKLLHPEINDISFYELTKLKKFYDEYSKKDSKNILEVAYSKSTSVILKELYLMGRESSLEKLIVKAIDIGKKDEGNFKLAELIVQNTSNYAIYFDKTILKKAIISNAVEILKIIFEKQDYYIEHGSDDNRTSRYILKLVKKEILEDGGEDDNLLHKAMNDYDVSLPMIQLLLSKKVAVREDSIYNVISNMWRLWSKDKTIEIIKLLLEYDANPNGKGSEGESAVSFLAAKYLENQTYKEILEILLKHNAISLTDEDKILLEPIMLLALELEDAKFIELLVNKGVHSSNSYSFNKVIKLYDQESDDQIVENRDDNNVQNSTTEYDQFQIETINDQEDRHEEDNQIVENMGNTLEIPEAQEEVVARNILACLMEVKDYVSVELGSLDTLQGVQDATSCPEQCPDKKPIDKASGKEIQEIEDIILDWMDCANRTYYDQQQDDLNAQGEASNL